jgi:hypothetical protein
MTLQEPLAPNETASLRRSLLGMRQLHEASDGASFAGLSAGILWMPFGPDGIIWTTIRIGSLAGTARPLQESDVQLVGEWTNALMASPEAQNSFS